MKPIYSILLFAAILLTAVLTSVRNYGCTRESVVADMNQALAKTLDEKTDAWITPDTIADYRSHLRMAMLRRSSVIYYAMDEPKSGLCSQRMTWGKHGQPRLTFQGFANCSMASLWLMSDQRLPLSLTVVAMLWAVFSVIYFRRQRRGFLVLGGVMLDTARRQFLTLRREEVALTPMQRQLLLLFFDAAGHRLDKQAICDALWPRKPDASDTLYTLIRRIRPTLSSLGLTITTSRGRDYELKAQE